MNHLKDKRQKTIPHPMPAPPPLSVHFEKYVSYIMLIGVANSYIMLMLSSSSYIILTGVARSYLFLVFDSSRLFDSTKIFEKINTPHY